MRAAKLIIRTLEGNNSEAVLEEGASFQIGRAEGNEYKILSTKVSRFHAAIRATDNGVVVQDLGSLNGTFLNGKLIGSTAVLKSGDRVTVAGAEFIVELLQEGSANRTQETRPLELQAYTGSLLVSDIRGYTRLSEELPAQELASVLRVWTERVSMAVASLDGVVDKFIGDSVLAYWLRPSNSGDATKDAELAEKAFAAAKKIEAETQAMESSVLWPFSPKYRWSVKSSLASGEVIFGNIGRGDARSFTVIGDTVNIVFRMNDLCTELKRDLLTDESTAKLMLNSHKFMFMENFKLEGRRETIKVFTPQDSRMV